MVVRDDELVEVPRRVEEVARDAGYRLVYALRGPAGGALLQRVETTVRALDAAGATVVEYAGRYEELLRLDARGEARDLHSFELERDGWSRRALAALLLRLTPTGAAPPATVTRLELEKRFLLGAAAPGADGASRVLAGATARLVVRGAGWELTLPAPASPAAGAGQAAWLDGPRWTAREWFGWGAASASGRLRTPGYQATRGGAA